jgi:predicted enzyme related to lactoylglutathione lyase
MNTHRKETIMNATASAVSVDFAALNFDCADPALVAEFWGKALGRPVSPGAVAGDMAVGVTDPAKGPRLIFHPAAEVETVTYRVGPILMTDQHDAETERLTGLGAKLLNKIRNDVPPVRHSRFADPEGNEFDLITWQ